MNIKAFGLLLLSVLTNTVMQFFLKKGSQELGQVNTSDFFRHIWTFILTPELLAAITCSSLAIVFEFLVLTRVDLSVAGPASAMRFIFYVALGHFVFQEQVSFTHLVGLGAIVCGVVLVSFKSLPEKEKSRAQ